MGDDFNNPYCVPGDILLHLETFLVIISGGGRMPQALGDMGQGCFLAPFSAPDSSPSTARTSGVEKLCCMPTSC